MTIKVLNEQQILTEAMQVLMTPQRTIKNIAILGSL
jgi:hypothetical protein